VPLRQRNRGCREIDAQDAVAARGQPAGMPAGSASEVGEGRARLEDEPAEQSVDECGRLAFVTMRVQRLVAANRTRTRTNRVRWSCDV